MKRFSEIPQGQDLRVKKEENKKYRCPICQDHGFYFKGDIAYPCRCSKEKMKNIKREKAGITPHLARQTFDRFDLSYYPDDARGTTRRTYYENAKAILAASKQFVADYCRGENNGGLLFEGSVASGKTFLAASCANALLDRGVDVKFIIVPDFLDQLRETFHEGSDYSESQLMDDVKKADVLFLDDLGAHNYTEWSIKTIFAIINYRVNYEKPMVVTTNLDKEEIEKLLGSRIYSRLLEACKFFRLECSTDMRWKTRMHDKGKG